MIRLIVTAGDGPVRTCRFDQTIIRIGRDPSSDMVLRSGFISGRHGEIHVEGSLVAYEDHGTTNGSVLRRDDRLLPVDARNFSRVLLRDGDELVLGGPQAPVVVRVELPAARPTPIAAGSRETPEVDATHAESVGRMREASDRAALLMLHDLATRLAGSLDVDALLPVLVESVLDAFRRANHVTVYLKDESSGEFRPALARGRRGDTRPHPVSRTVRDSVLARGKAVLFNVRDEGFTEAASLHGSSVRGGLCAPLWNGHEIVGLLQADCRGLAIAAFDKRDLELLVLLAHQAALALENARLHGRLRIACEDSIRGLVRALEAKDRYTSGHSEAVAALASSVAAAMDLPTSEIETVRRAALLHDVGKIGIPHDVLGKADGLTPAEQEVMTTHSEIGARILEPLEFLRDIVPIVLHHHERWDGRGYPRGLSAEEIPLGARILAVVDAYHSLVSDRADRAAVAPPAALRELQRSRGAQFDPRIVDTLVEVVEASGKHVELAGVERR